MSIEEKVRKYNELQSKRRLLGARWDETLDNQVIQLALNIERTHSLYLDIEDNIFKVTVGSRSHLYLGTNWSELGKE